MERFPVNDEPADADDGRLTDLLRACDEALAAGSSAEPVVRNIPLDVKNKLEPEIEWCRLVRRLLPRVATSKKPTGGNSTLLFRKFNSDWVLPGTESRALPPNHFGRFQIRRELGRGACGVVFLAFDPKLGREVALKVPRPEVIVHPELRSRFAQEARAAAGLDHPNLVPVYEAHDDGAFCYIASAYCPGVTLTAWLKARTDPVPCDLAARLIAVLAEAVEHAHRRGILHRDLKPGNIMLSPRSAGDDASTVTDSARVSEKLEFVPRIMDFGLAKLLQGEPGEIAPDHLTQSGAIVGTPNYMAPEQAGGDNNHVGPATDVYALGAILYEVLTGRPPFRGEQIVKTLLMVRNQEPAAPGRLRSDVPRDLETICLKCLHKDPPKRYVSAQALAEDLGRYLGRQPIMARRVGLVGRAVLWCRRNPALASTVAASGMALAVVAGMSLYQVYQERDRYRQERDKAQANLYQSLVGEARALRLARGPGYRAEAFGRLQRALALETPARDPYALRQEAIACLGDFVGLEPAVWSDVPPERLVVAQAVSPAGNEVALGMTNPRGDEGIISLRDRVSGRETARLVGHNAGVFAVIYGAGGNLLVSADDKGSIKTWVRQAEVWKCTRTLKTEPSRRPGYVHAVSLALSPSQQRLFVCSRLTNVVRVWDLGTGAEVESFRATGAHLLYGMTVSHDGKWLAAVEIWPTDVNEVLVWEVATHKLVSRIAPGLGPINEVVLGPGDKYLACACDGGVAVFDAPEFRSRLFVRGDSPNSVAFSPNGHLLAIPALQFGIVRLWDIRANRETALLKHPGEPHAVAFTNDGAALIAVGAGLVHVWDLYCNGEKVDLPGHDHAVLSVSFSPDGGRLLSSGADGKLRISDPHTGRLLGQLNGPVRSALGGDGRTLVSVEDSGDVKTWEVSDPASVRVLRVYKHAMGSAVWSASISPDGAYLAASGALGLTLWKRDEPRGSRLAEESVFSCTFSPDGRLLVWGHNNGVSVRDCIRQTQAWFTFEHVRTGSFSFFPDNRRMVMVNSRREIEAFDVVDRKPLYAFGTIDLGGHSDFFTGRQSIVSPDGKWLAIQAPSIPVWDVDAKKQLFTLPVERTEPHCLAWSRNCEMLAVGSNDGGLAVWSIPALRAQLARLGLDW
jgi:WD40 repeat protein